MIGETISHYRILEKIGGGGMGIVYKAQDLKLDRFVALKFLPPNLTTDEELKIRFIHEAKAASSIDHNNICTIYDIEETKDGQLFISMAYYNGETLKKKIERTPLNICEALDIAVQVAEGLDKAHKKDIIHRDIKPANIMITEDGVAKIVDFGLAKLSRYTKLTKDGASVGTITYMSPEQTKGEEVDSRSDIWSLGVVFYEMITGQLPFKGDYDQAVIYSIINEDPVPLLQLNSELSNNLEFIVQKTLAKDPNKRYQTVNELLDDLIAIREESNISKRPLKSARTSQQKKRIIWIGGFLFTCLCTMFILFYPSKSIPFAERDWILITDFENFTEEFIFNKSLNTALSISIDQSQYVNVLSRRRMIEALTRMKKPNHEKIDEKIGREIAIREGIDIYIVPGISKIGNQYALMSKIQETATGNTLQSNIFYAEDHTEILEKMDDLSENIRKSLGESLFKIQLQSKKLAKVTTTSLEALQQYSLAIEQHIQTNFEQARIYYQNALEIDTNFVSAKASLGNILLEKFDREKGRELLTEAIKSVDNLTDREKYGILAFHAVNVENNLEKGIKYTRMRCELYPDDAIIHNNLGWYYQISGRYEEALTEYKEAIRINTFFMLAYGGILWNYLVFVGEMDSAYVWAQKMLLVDQQNAWANFYLGSACVGLDSLEKAILAFERAGDLNPKMFISFYRLAHVLRLKKCYNEAIEVLNQILQINPNETSANYDKGIIYDLLDNKDLAETNFLKYFKTTEDRYKNNPDDADACISLAILYSHLRKKDLAWELSQKAMTIDSTLFLRYTEFYALENKKTEAVDQFKKLLESGYRDLVWLRINPELQSLHDDERYNKLLAQYFNE